MFYNTVKFNLSIIRFRVHLFNYLINNNYEFIRSHSNYFIFKESNLNKHYLQ